MFSLLMHLLVFISLNVYLQFHPTLLKESKIDRLEVRLAHSLPPKPQPMPEKKLLATPAPAAFKVAQASIQNPPVIVPSPPAPVVENIPAEQSAAVTGIAFPGAVATPFPGQGRSNNSIFHISTAQQDAERTYYQQAMEAQARQRSEFQAQLIIQQLHQMLEKLIGSNPITGKCVLIEITGRANYRFNCDNGTLFEVISNNQKDIATLLIALRETGRIFNGFAVENPKGKAIITLSNDH